jgi:hypothetical protein
LVVMFAIGSCWLETKPQSGLTSKRWLVVFSAAHRGYLEGSEYSFSLMSTIDSPASSPVPF